MGLLGSEPPRSGGPSNLTDEARWRFPAWEGPSDPPRRRFVWCTKQRLGPRGIGDHLRRCGPTEDKSARARLRRRDDAAPCELRRDRAGPAEPPDGPAWRGRSTCRCVSATGCCWPPCFAPLHAVEPLSSPSLARADRALDAMLTHHEPFPAVVMNRQWELQRANDGAVRLFTQLFAPHDLPAPPNILRTIIEPGPGAPASATDDVCAARDAPAARQWGACSTLPSPPSWTSCKPETTSLGPRPAERRAGRGSSSISSSTSTARSVLLLRVSTIGTPGRRDGTGDPSRSVLPSDDATTTTWLGR